jgi:hypothetical protein
MIYSPTVQNRGGREGKEARLLTAGLAAKFGGSGRCRSVRRKTTASVTGGGAAKTWTKRSIQGLPGGAILSRR